MEQIYFTSDYLTVYHNAERSTVRAVWRGFLSSEQFRSAMTLCYDFAEEAGVVNWIGDNRLMNAIRMEDQAWALEALGPRMKTCPIRKMAVVVSHDIFNHLAVDNLVTKASDLIPFEVRHFTDVEAAVAWMEEGDLPQFMHAITLKEERHGNR